METHTFMSHSEFNLTICILSLFNCRQLLCKQLSEITEFKKKKNLCVFLSHSHPLPRLMMCWHAHRSHIAIHRAGAC